MSRQKTENFELAYTGSPELLIAEVIMVVTAAELTD